MAFHILGINMKYYSIWPCLGREFIIMIYQQMEFDIFIHAANFENTLELNWPMV